MRLLTGSLLLVAALVFVLVNTISGTLLQNAKFDITQSHSYTLSKNSKEIIFKLQEPVILRFYFSASSTQPNHYLHNYAARVQAMLKQYQNVAKDKILLEIIDPKPFSKEEEDAVNYGLQGINLGDQEIYFGLVGTNSRDAQQVIPFFVPNREGNLEYDISQLLYNLANPQSKIIGVMSALPLKGIAGKPWVIRQQIDQLFVIKDIDLNEPIIPSYVKTLMVVDPSNFSDTAIRAIDEFVQNGGHVLAFIDPYSELAGKATGAGNAEPLLRSWGIEMRPDYVVADRNLARTVRLQHAGHELNVNYPLWMDFTAANFNKDDVLTAVMDRMTLATPGAIQPMANATTYFMPLIKTSNDAMLVPSKEIPDTQVHIVDFINNYHVDGQFTVAARVSGPINSPFTDQSVEQSSIIVVADTDMLYDHFWVSTQNLGGNDYDVAASGNGNFVLSAIDNLLGSNELIGIRNRGVFTRPFVKLQTLSAQARDNDLDIRQARHKLHARIDNMKVMIQFISFGIAPVLIILIGLAVYFRPFRRVNA